MSEYLRQIRGYKESILSELQERLLNMQED